MFLRNIIATLLSKGFIMILTFGLVVLSTNFWGSEGRGMISIIIADVAIIATFSNLLGGSCITYFIPKLGAEKLILPAYLWIFITSLTGALIFHIFQPQISFLFLFLLSLFLSFQSLHLNIFASKENFKSFNTLSVLLPLFNLAFVFFYIHVFSVKNYNAYFLSYLTALIITWIICLVFSKKYIQTKLTFSLTDVKQAFNYGYQNELANIIHFVNFRISYFLILHYMGVNSVGLYSVAIALAEAIWLIVRSISVVQYSKIVNNSTDDSRILTINAARFSLYFSLFAAVLFLIFPNEGYQLIFGKDFSNVKPIMLVLLPGIIALSFSNIHAGYFTANGKLMPSIIKSVIGLVFTLFLMPLLINRYGLMGAGIATSVSYLATTIYLVSLFYKGSKFSFSHISIKPRKLTH